MGNMDIPQRICMLSSCGCSPPLSVMNTRIDLHLSFPQIVSLCDGPHLLQEEAIGVHDQDILVDLCDPANLSAQCDSQKLFCITIQSNRLRVILFLSSLWAITLQHCICQGGCGLPLPMSWYSLSWLGQGCTISAFRVLWR